MDESMTMFSKKVNQSQLAKLNTPSLNSIGLQGLNKGNSGSNPGSKTNFGGFPQLVQSATNRRAKGLGLFEATESNSPLMNILANNDSSTNIAINALNASCSHEDLNQDNKLSIELRKNAQSGAGLFGSQTKKSRYDAQHVNQSLIFAKGSNDYDLKQGAWPNKNSKTSRASTLNKSQGIIGRSVKKDQRNLLIDTTVN